ncbi:calsyntenin-1-like isoform X2 [Physella acuta]|uniref:calsyntenin-1-like isoform X2 n=1 Tax=Physella acuta TaxID=109671 RepID=UPI0027DC6B03|nr:calsyntenin-1-like isoform X2 [Physella acuta]
MAKFNLIILAIVIVPYASSLSEPNRFKPVIWSKLMEHDKPAFHGEVKENERVVQLKPDLLASDPDEMGGAKYICNYIIAKSKRHPRSNPLPFEIVVTDKVTGAAEIRVKEGERLNYEEQPFYKFSIVAEDCGTPPKQSTKAYVMIKVLDVDEFAPKFDNDSYFATVEEDRIYDTIVKIHATDLDESSSFKTICSYELITPNVPFEITNEGIVRNKEPLDYSIHRNFILGAVATDCGGRKSEPVYINLTVKEKCRSGWVGLQDVIKYRAGSGQQRLAEGATLQLCDNDCKPAQVNVKLTLTTKHIGKGCDRDTYSVNSQRKLCGASGDSVDLLPSPSSADWSHNIPTDDGHEMDQVFSFDGVTNALEVPESVFNHMLHKHFTISAWLRHEEMPVANQSKPPKEHILCMSDSDGMNRHHYGLYIHGKKLVLLLRKEAEDVQSPEEMKVFRPAEFRWTIPQVSDDRWHHFAVSVDLQEESKDGGVHLYIDGKLLQTDDSNFEIIDDWPLHKTKKVHGTKLTVGACWQGAENTFSHYYKGYMAGLFVLKGKTESERVIKCLNNCKENLDFHAVGDMSSGTSVSFNSEMTEFTISSRSIEEVNRLMAQVAYVNARTYPTPGHRILNIETSLLCEGQTVVLPLLEKKILVQEQQEPVFVITGYSNLTRMVYEFERGLRVFHDIHIFARSQPLEELAADSQEGQDDEAVKAAKLALKLSKTMLQQSTEQKDDEFMIDECHVKADPPLNLFIEHLSLPTHLMEIHGLEWSETNDGVVIRNADTIPNYENVIRNIHYYHNKPEELANRTLTLYCSSQNQRFISTKFIERLVAVHQAPPPPRPANIQSNAQGIHQSLKNPSSDSIHAVGAASSNLGMVAIIVVCVGFLLFMIVLGVIRIRAAHKRTQVVQVDEKQEMEWDNSALNITINPMEQEMFEYEDGARPTFPEDSDSDEDEESSMQGDYGDSSEDEEPAPQGKGPGVNELEWDHTSF